MIIGYVVETGQGIYGPFMPNTESGIAFAVASAHAFLEKNMTRLVQPVVIRPLLEPTKLPR